MIMRTHFGWHVGIALVLLGSGISFAWTAEPSAAIPPGNVAWSDPANVAPPPAYAIGFPSRNADLDALPGFRRPPPGYGIVSFYWWLGDPLTIQRLVWQLDRLVGKGVMSLQINYAHSDQGGLFWGLTYRSDPPLFSPAWWNLFDEFLHEAKKRGIAVSLSDYTLGIGQGWCVDEMLCKNPDLNGAILRLEEKTVDGGAELVWWLPADTLMAAAYRLDGNRVIPDSGIDLREQLSEGTLRWQAPEGHWRVVAVRAERVYFSLDPMHRQSGSEYARHFFGRFDDRYPNEGGKGLNFFFSDELDFRLRGNLWNPQFADEFRRRKGYDIVAELPALFFDVGPRTPKVRLDFSDVKVALSEEGFFLPVFEWHQRRGMIFGCDHGGRGLDVTEFGNYFRTQRWNQGPGCDQPNLSRDVIKNKVASSIAHLYQRPRVWLEGYHSSGWGTSSADLTDATFANYVMGQNLLGLHGLYYSTHGGWWEWAPPCNHFRMPYWGHLDGFMTCVQRLSYLLSQGDHRCDVAVMYPVAPMEAGLGGDEAVRSAFDLGRYLYNHSMDFDFIDFQSLARAKVEDQQLRVSGEAYRVLVLPAMRAVRQSTLDKAREFVRGGGIVVALDALPEAGDRVGRNDPELDAAVKEIFGLKAAEAVGRKEPHLQRNTAGGVGILAQTPQQVFQTIDKAFPRDFAVLSAAPSPMVMHRRIGPRDLYAVYGAPENIECFFRVQGRAELWDPWTGETRPLAVRSQTTEGTTLRLPLTEKEIQLVVFTPGTPDVEAADHPKPEPTVLALDGAWQCELQPVLDNRWGDFRWPPSERLLGAEARQFHYREATAPDFAGQDPQLDDSEWPIVTASFGPQFWKLGPLPEGDTTALETRLVALDHINPTEPLVWNRKKYTWQPYEFSWRWSIEHDPGHQGYHGLKEQVHDEFLAVGKCMLTATGSTYKLEEGGKHYYFWTSVASPRDCQAHTRSGGLRPVAAWLDGKRLKEPDAPVALYTGNNPLLLRYDQPGRGYYVVDVSAAAGDTSASAREAVAGPPPVSAALATRWYANPAILPFDIHPQTARPAGWYRFVAAPGLKSMTITAHGRVEAWVDGLACRVTAGKQRKDGAVVYQVKCEQPIASCGQVAIRVEQEHDYYGGATLVEPIELHCGRGMITAGDWSKIDGLHCYSGGIWYRKVFRLSAKAAIENVILDLGQVVASAEVHVNGKLAGIKVAPPWNIDITPLVLPGPNRLEVLVYNTLANHYVTIPTRFRGDLRSGMVGPVQLEISHEGTAKQKQQTFAKHTYEGIRSLSRGSVRSTDSEYCEIK